ncbi:hypothetical protein P6U16_00030 [Rhizobium sp. 32-5/1]|uniref:hypothetical protein n=1 Tax=Rhizobium sp. 32-5/1 TaxID=3019602 RepID=UPI00240D142E|nr:hypothetical protein [Rhizobium sp. 32-5/1]WEZ83335.1 hypothetical protein P6U16_00030 [Rhizobium sp. 32-5/1]
MKRIAAWVALVVLTGWTPVLADGREELVRSYVDRIVVNSLDEPDRHQAYFTESQLLNDFSGDFVNTYADALKASRKRGDPALFETDPMTGDTNRCPIGKTGIIDRTRSDTRNMLDVTMETPSCDGAPVRSIRLMFILEQDDPSSGLYRIDDVLRFIDEGNWFSLKAWLERQTKP